MAAEVEEVAWIHLRSYCGAPVDLSRRRTFAGDAGTDGIPKAYEFIAWSEKPIQRKEGDVTMERITRLVT